MLVDNVVKRPYKIRIEVRTYDKTKFTVTLASNSTRAIRPVIEAINMKPYIEYIDRYGYIRIVYKNLNWAQVQRIRDIARNNITAESAKAVVPHRKKHVVSYA